MQSMARSDGHRQKPAGTESWAEDVRSAVAVEMFEITQRLPSCALEQVLAFVHLLDEATTVDARTTVESGCLQLVITAPMQN